jgi:hypothetical protein
MFNQVSIIAINCLGTQYPVKSSDVTVSAPSSSLEGRFEEEMHYDSVTVEKLKQLDEAKKLAVS